MDELRRRLCLVSFPVVGAGLASPPLIDAAEPEEEVMYAPHEERVGTIEKELGIFDLRQFTPR